MMRMTEKKTEKKPDMSTYDSPPLLKASCEHNSDYKENMLVFTNKNAEPRLRRLEKEK
jgi:hypothetical protein